MFIHLVHKSIAQFNQAMLMFTGGNTMKITKTLQTLMGRFSLNFNGDAVFAMLFYFLFLETQ